MSFTRHRSQAGQIAVSIVFLVMLCLMTSCRTSNPADAEEFVLPTKGSLFTNSLGMEFVPVPGTEVLFCKWETRVQDFEAFVKETGYDAGNTWKSPGFPQGPTYPVCGVSWDDANQFCEWLTKKERDAGRIGPNQRYKLPKDWEWSAAVGLNESSGGTPESKSCVIKDVYPWGTEWPPPKGAGNYNASLNVDSYDSPSPIGTFAANRHGIYDMGGNLWEWCEDSDLDMGRIIRGQCWGIGEQKKYLLSSYRGDCGDHTTRNTEIGFRCVLTCASP